MDVTRRIRTSPPNTRREIPAEKPQAETRLVARILRTVIDGRRFDDSADVREALRLRLKQLRIRYSQAAFDDAISLVATNRVLVTVESRRAVESMFQSEPPVSRREAAALVAQLGIRVRGLA